LNFMRIILRIALVSVPCIAPQSAFAAVSADASATQVSSDSAAVSDKKQRQRSVPAATAAGVRRNSNANASADTPRDAGSPQRGIGQAARSNSDRVRSLLNRQAIRPRTAAVAASRRGAASTAVSSRHPAAQTSAAGALRKSDDPGHGVGNLGRAVPSIGAALATPNRAVPRASVALPQNSAARIGTLGGPRAAGYSRLGGPASGKAAHAAALGGTQLLHRQY
jgi:hypothetical protein